MNVIIIRAPPAADATAKRAQEAGFDTLVAPLFSVEALPWPVPNPADYDGLLVTSANAIRQGGSGIKSLGKLPVLAVGPTTAEAAGIAALQVALTGEEGAQQLVEAAYAKGFRKLLWLRGADFTPFVSPAAMTCDSVAVYRHSALPIGKKLTKALTKSSLFLVHSARSAEHLAREMARCGIAKDQHCIAALSSTIANSVGEGWREIITAKQPNDVALLSVAQSLVRKYGP